MLYIIIALNAEASPFIDRYKLEDVITKQSSVVITEITVCVQKFGITKKRQK